MAKIKNLWPNARAIFAPEEQSPRYILQEQADYLQQMFPDNIEVFIEICDSISGLPLRAARFTKNPLESLMLGSPTSKDVRLMVKAKASEYASEIIRVRYSNDSFYPIAAVSSVSSKEVKVDSYKDFVAYLAQIFNDPQTKEALKYTINLGRPKES